MNRTFGCVRYVWNKALAERVRRYKDEGASSSYVDTAKWLTAWKKDEESSFLREVSKSTDWTIAQDHKLGVQVGTITARGWNDVPSGNTITVSAAKLALTTLDPKTDHPTQGDRSPYLDQYLSGNTATLDNMGPGTFPLTASRH